MGNVVDKVIGLATDKKSQVEKPVISSSEGAADASKVVGTDVDGKIGTSLLRTAAASTGAPDAGKIPVLDGSGKMPTSMLPTGSQEATTEMTTSEALSNGDFVNIHDQGGAKVRKADGSVAGKPAEGFVLSSAAAGAPVNVYFSGSNTGVTGMTPGKVFLSTTPGKCTSTPPAGAGNVVQCLGVAIGAAEVKFLPEVPVALAGT